MKVAYSFKLTWNCGSKYNMELPCYILIDKKFGKHRDGQRIPDLGWETGGTPRIEK